MAVVVKSFTIEELLDHIEQLFSEEGSVTGLADPHNAEPQTLEDEEIETPASIKRLHGYEE